MFEADRGYFGGQLRDYCAARKSLLAGAPPIVCANSTVPEYFGLGPGPQVNTTSYDVLAVGRSGLFWGAGQSYVLHLHPSQRTSLAPLPTTLSLTNYLLRKSPSSRQRAACRMWECTGSGRCSVKRHKLLKVREMRMVCDVRTDHERAGTGESLKSSILNIWRNRVLILQKFFLGEVAFSWAVESFRQCERRGRNRPE